MVNVKYSVTVIICPSPQIICLLPYILLYKYYSGVLH